MKSIGIIVAVGLTAIIIIAISVSNILLASEASDPEVNELPPEPIIEAAAVDAAVQAAYEARESLLTMQIENIEAEIIERQQAYDDHLKEINRLILDGENQLAQLGEQEIQIQRQIDELLVTQSERALAYEDQRQQAYYQYQGNIQQLQAQLDEGRAKLNEALTRLGQ